MYDKYVQNHFLGTCGCRRRSLQSQTKEILISNFSQYCLQNVIIFNFNWFIMPHSKVVGAYFPERGLITVYGGQLGNKNISPDRFLSFIYLIQIFKLFLDQYQYYLSVTSLISSTLHTHRLALPRKLVFYKPQQFKRTQPKQLKAGLQQEDV